MTAALPTFVIIGSMRSGSTSLYKYLQDHPQVFMPRKEIHFFDQRWDHGLDWYRGRFEGWAGQPAIGEATPSYLADPVALDRLAATLPDARLVAILRDPVDRAYSHYWMERARERESRAFAEVVAAELAGGEPGFLARGRYAEQLRAVRSRFGPQQPYVLLFDDLRDEPAAAYAGVCRAIGVDDGFVPARLGDRVNRYVGFRSRFLRERRRRLPTALGFGRAVRRLNAVEGGYPPIDAGLRSELVAAYAGERAELEAELGRSLPPSWTR